MPTVRKRTQSFALPPIGGGTHTVYNLDGTIFSQTPQPKLFPVNSTVCYDVDHSILPPRRVVPLDEDRDVRWTDGDDFALYNHEWHSMSCSGPGLYRDGLREYNGDFHANIYEVPADTSTWTFPWTPTAEYSYLDSQGPTAWNRFKPGKPVVNVGQFIAEARDLPLLFKVKLKSFKDLGSDYLNVEFGWKPFLDDMQKLFTAQREVIKRLEQLKRDNGRPVRRRGDMIIPVEKVEFSSTVQQYQALKPILTTGYYKNVPKWTRRKTVTYHVWFSGRFRYWIPDIGSDQWTKRAVRALYGLNPTPSLLWEVLPFSWLVDWFSNIGDVLNNISENAAESLVAEYAYLMRTTQRSRESIGEAEISTEPNHSVYAKVTARHVTTATLKTRRKATPYGFSVAESSLTARQWAILGALGLTFS